MIPDENDTIVAAATALGVGGRGVVRISGPDALGLLSAIATGESVSPPASPCRIADLTIEIELAGKARRLPVDAWVWPTTRSYTRQPTVELQTHAAAPVLDAVVRACCQQGARLATPGEFTLRAFLSGRIDLTQAEAVLGVIDAAGEADLNHALGRLAGGLSTPLDTLREDLTQLLAELEAGLDFVEEEDIRFIERAELTARVAAGQQVVHAAIEQATARGEASTFPTVVLAGSPNAGKSRLFNALRDRAGVQADGGDAIVSPTAGTTRDALTTLLESAGVRFWLVDTAGVDDSPADTGALSGIDTAAADQTGRSISSADLVLRCTPADKTPAAGDQEIAVATKTDLAAKIPHPLQGEGPGEGAPQAPGSSPSFGSHPSPGSPLSPGSASTARSRTIATSAVTGAGLETLLSAVVEQLADTKASSSTINAGVSARCRQALKACGDALDRAAAVAMTGDDELTAEELRQALAALGDVVGATATDDLLDRIFGQFCIGK